MSAQFQGIEALVRLYYANHPAGLATKDKCPAMENRFTFKDFIVCSLLVVVIVLVVLAMIQFDRQYARVVNVQERLQQVTEEQSRARRQIAAIQEAIEAGVNVASPAPTTQAAGGSTTTIRPQLSRAIWRPCAGRPT